MVLMVAMVAAINDNGTIQIFDIDPFVLVIVCFGANWVNKWTVISITMFGYLETC